MICRKLTFSLKRPSGWTANLIKKTPPLKFISAIRLITHKKRTRNAQLLKYPSKKHWITWKKPSKNDTPSLRSWPHLLKTLLNPLGTFEAISPSSNQRKHSAFVRVYMNPELPFQKCHWEKTANLL